MYLRGYGVGYFHDLFFKKKAKILSGIQYIHANIKFAT